MLQAVSLDFDIQKNPKLGVEIFGPLQFLPRKDALNEFLKLTMDFVSAIHHGIYPESDNLQKSHNFFQNFALAILHEYIFLGTLDELYKGNLGKSKFRRLPLETFNSAEINSGKATLDIDLYSWDELSFHFPPDIRKKELLEFINTNWSFISVKREEFCSIKNNRLKVYANFLRDIYIFNTFIKILSIPPKERKAKLGIQGTYVEGQVINFIKKNTCQYKSLPNEGTLKNIYQKLKKALVSANYVKGNALKDTP